MSWVAETMQRVRVIRRDESYIRAHVVTRGAHQQPKGGCTASSQAKGGCTACSQPISTHGRLAAAESVNTDWVCATPLLLLHSQPYDRRRGRRRHDRRPCALQQAHAYAQAAGPGRGWLWQGKKAGQHHTATLHHQSVVNSQGPASCRRRCGAHLCRRQGLPPALHHLVQAGTSPQDRRLGIGGQFGGYHVKQSTIHPASCAPAGGGRLIMSHGGAKHGGGGAKHGSGRAKPTQQTVQPARISVPCWPKAHLKHSCRHKRQETGCAPAPAKLQGLHCTCVGNPQSKTPSTSSLAG
jgi:hypothetical protein